MKSISIGNNTIELDENLVQEFETATCSEIESCAPVYIACVTKEHDMDKAFLAYSVKEIIDIVTKGMKMDIAMFSGKMY